MAEQQTEPGAEQMMQNAFAVYVEGVDSIDQAQQFSRFDGLGVERGLHKSNAIAHFQRAANWARWSREVNPNIDQ